MIIPTARGLGDLADVPRRRNGIEASAVVERLQEALMQRGIPLRRVRAAIAEVCEITPQSVFHWFNGRTRMPRADHLARLAQHFEIDLMWLILGEGPDRF